MLSWGQALRVYLLLCLLTGTTQVFLLVRGRSDIRWPIIQASLLVLGGLLSWGFRYLCQVRVSRAGLSGVGGRLMKWSEVTAIAKGCWPLGGFVLQSAYTPSVMVSESIARDADFRERVLAYAPAGHAILEQLS